jgi:hypothetical protein
MAAENVLHTGRIEYESGGRVFFSAEKVGFPRGFRLERGDRVTLCSDAHGQLRVKPLIRAAHAVDPGASHDPSAFTVFLLDGENGSRVLGVRPA